MLEIIHLEIIQELDKQKSLTKAAETLCLSQSALSHTIKKLEQQLGVALWVRDGRYLRLTQAGLYLLSLSSRILPQLNHAEMMIQQYAEGKAGNLRIGLECYPCYQWLLKVVSPYLEAWPNIDIDVKQKFKFGGLDALENYEIDLLVTPDPIFKEDLLFQPVFDYEQILVVGKNHPLKDKKYIQPTDLLNEILITYPVPADRLDIYSQFLIPAGIVPHQHKTIETTDIILQMVESHRGVTALPLWLVKENMKQFKIAPVRLGKHGISKHIHVGIRKKDQALPYIQSFIDQAMTVELY
ncbi:LysR family transcriptional regulator [Commensalibacter communis]|uniref:LysR family transcriptional regulator n=1 Tax=Commensalibacter communis TaxID=2972786 RepID=UPI0022FFAABF|nr:LysR family transcriptional regulator [Commensalibacter communis]CAI3945355.1 DNA-binding transcriptional regulator [Commensalibacter communis]CAI3945531.1 DNA-binding transcriptional regulator [Commensalibacter communis]